MCVIKSETSYVAKKKLERALISEENKKITEFIDSHKFSFTINDDGELITNISERDKEDLIGRGN